VLLQAIARVNRPYEDDAGRRKPSGFVLDFVGIFEKLEKALAFDSEDVESVVEGVDVLKERFTALMEEARTAYLLITRGKTGDKMAEAVLEHFRDEERRQTFHAFFRELQDIYEILSPDAFLRPFLGDYEELGRMHHLVRTNYERDIPVDKSFLRKTARLVQVHTQAGEVREPTTVHILDEAALAQIAASNKPDTVKVFNLLKALHDLVHEQAHEQPWLISIGDRAEAIARAFEQRQRTTREALATLEELLGDLREAVRGRSETDLAPEAFAVLWYLKKEGVAQAEAVAHRVAVAFESHPHWQVSSHQEQEVRKAPYKALINVGVDGVVELANGVLHMLRRASS
jgi:type I restriction enzyme R subunit